MKNVKDSISLKIKMNNDLIDKDEISNGENNYKINTVKDSYFHDGIIIMENDNSRHKPKIESEDFQIQKLEENNDQKATIDKSINQKRIFKKKPNEKFKVPPELKKTFIITSILAILGVVLIVCGCIKAISDHTPGGGIMFWVLGSIVIIPGGFYSFQFYRAKTAKQKYRRKFILDNIPRL